MSNRSRLTICALVTGVHTCALPISLVAVRERLVFAGAAVAAALVEGDQFVADVDHGHAHVGQPPVVAHDAFALGQQRLADPAALQPGPDGEHSEVAVSVLFGHVRAGHQRVAAPGQHHAAARALDSSAERRLGPERVRQCKYRWSPYTEIKKNNMTTTY